MKATIITLFPEMFPGPLGHSLAGKALKEGIWELETIDIREFGLGKHHQVDDTPYGGGAGMVIRADVLGAVLDHTIELTKKRGQQAESALPVLRSLGEGGSSSHGEDSSPSRRQSNDNNPRIIYLSPRGTPLTQLLVKELSTQENLILICGRFEGIDERVIEHYGIEEISIGDYVLSGGEIAAYALLDGAVRLLDGVMGSENSATEESFALSGNNAGLLEYPHYTKPPFWEGLEVPEVLLSGNHSNISRWRTEQSEQTTKTRRPDLWEKRKKI